MTEAVGPRVDGVSATGGPAGDSGPAAAVALLVARGLTVGTAESLTGGLVCAALTSVPGSSDTVRGGVVAYAIDLKTDLLGVDPQRLSEVGAVDAVVAAQMARGVCRLIGTDVGLATTGVAGPGPADGVPAGTVHVAVAGPWAARPSTRALALGGDRDAVRSGAVTGVLALLVELLTASGDDTTHESLVDPSDDTPDNTPDDTPDR